MSSPPFAIILPVRNGGSYVRQAIDSIVAQTDGDWRLFVLENGSTDDTMATLASFDDPRITVLPSDRPLDIVANWHRGYDVVRDRLAGDQLTTFTGHDDYFYPDFVARMKALAAAAPDATLYQTLIDLVDADGVLIRPCKPVPAVETWADFAAGMAWNHRDSVGTGYVFRAADYLEVGGMPTLPRILYADHLLFLRLTRLGHKRADAMTGCAYRLHAASTSNSVSIPWLNDRLAAFSAFVGHLRDDFPEFATTDLGRAALQTWIGRELFVFDGPVVRRLLSGGNARRLADLQALLADLGGRADPAHWSYQASPAPVRLLRRARLQATYARAWLRR